MKRVKEGEWHYDLGTMEGLMSVEELRETLVKKHPFLSRVNEFERNHQPGKPSFEKSMQQIDELGEYLRGLSAEQQEIAEKFAKLCCTEHRTGIEDGHLVRWVR